MRIPVSIARASVGAASGKTTDSVRALEAVAADAARGGIPRYDFEARRALAEIERGVRPAAARARLDAQRAAATTRGFGLYAR